MCFSSPSYSPPPPPPPPAPAPAPVSAEQNTIVPGGDNRRRAAAIAAGRGTTLTGPTGVLTQANVGKSLLGS